METGMRISKMDRRNGTVVKELVVQMGESECGFQNLCKAREGNCISLNLLLFRQDQDRDKTMYLQLDEN